MRLKRLENQYRVWLNPADYRTLLAHADHHAAELAIRLGGEVGLRVSETVDVRMERVRESTEPGVDALFLKAWGKDTSGKNGSMGKLREAYLPQSVYDAMVMHALANDRAMDESLLGVSKRTGQAYIKRAAENAAETTGNDDFEKVSSHDLRARWATEMLVRKNMNPRVIMEVGGWESFNTVEPYLNAAFDDVIAEEFADAGIA